MPNNPGNIDNRPEQLKLERLTAGLRHPTVKMSLWGLAPMQVRCQLYLQMSKLV